MNQNPRHVAVIGGGAIGVSTAVHLLRSGADVTLVTEGELASGASGRSLSWLNSAGSRSREYHALRMAGIDRYRSLFAQDPSREWLQFGGGVYWDNDAASAVARHEYEVSHAYDSHLVGPESIASFTPGLNAAALAETSVFNPGEGWVSLPHLIEHLIVEFTQRGGTLKTNAGAARVEVDDDGRAAAVVTPAFGAIAVDAVVVACGPHTPDVVAPLGVHIGNASPVSMLVVTEPLDHDVRAVLNTPRAAVRPNPGQTIAIDHDWYEEHIVRDASGQYSIPEPVVEELLGEASRLLKGTPRLKANSWKIGLKPIPGDGEPVFGELEKVPGCYVAFTHSGATLALIAGELISYEVSRGERHPMLETFRPERFEG
ncbi:NAD(P)/FAD-dependent oxidoreductase [Sinomonas terrae]|uniref:FAD-binding oxidoreductase n=1 Tax=Sinomonas terrae TaxID=2908838 RepID=A0ABS9U5J4_9MICC|nr:FAD-binding oxidoreductase [Sinomonas terrae]MCH6471963.1 FAD-binding oxidoreductase [Sinomonas terrae]